MTGLVLRRANVSRPSGSWSETDFDVFDGDRDVGRIFRQADGAWFWGSRSSAPGARALAMPHRSTRRRRRSGRSMSAGKASQVAGFFDQRCPGLFLLRLNRDVAELQRCNLFGHTHEIPASQRYFRPVPTRP
jgi:hypothetical protein